MWEEKVNYFTERNNDFIRKGVTADYKAKWIEK